MTQKLKRRISETEAWLYVLLGGALEIIWASGFKYEQIPSIVVLAALIISFDLIIRATKVLPVGTVYAVFTGIGTLGTTGVEMAVEGSVNLVRAGIILVLLACIIGLKMTSEGNEAS